MGFYNISEDSDGQYTTTGVGDASEVTDRNPFSTPFGGDMIIPVDFKKGTTGMRGWIDTSSLSLHVQLMADQSNWTGPYGGNLKDGLAVNFNTDDAKGRVSVYLKNGNEVWLSHDLGNKGESKVLILPI